MSYFNKLKSNKDRVRAMLMDHPELKDDDNRLIAHYWRMQLAYQGFSISSSTAEDLLRHIAKGKLDPPETIRRNRANLQRFEPETRGKSYDYRQADGKETSMQIPDL